MLTVRFFAQFREALDCDALEVPWQAELSDLDALEAALRARGENWRQVLDGDNLIRALNHVVVDSNVVLNDGDEIAFFPPMTGG